jgi:phage baseplate assembly protein W
MVNLASRRSRPFLGQGLSFPLGINSQGGLSLSNEDKSIIESIWIILLTDVGERLYRPDFGCRLSELSFAPINSETLMLMRIFVQEALEQWEPRIIVEQVLARPDADAGRVDLVIQYRVHDRYDRRSLVYPFYLQSPEL